MDTDEFLKQSLALMGGEDMRRFWGCIQETAGFHLSRAECEPFLLFHRYITEPEPPFITQWRADPKKERWYRLLVNGLGHVQNSFACVRYHQERARAIEVAAHSCFEKAGVQDRLGNSTVGGGNNLALDFEYQAYVLAYRRCLDQFARALAAYFRNDHHSFRHLPKLLKKAKPTAVAEAISAVIEKRSVSFDFVLSAPGENSVRDRIAHHEFVPAGVINISARGFILMGGGEELGLQAGPVPLGEVLARRTEELLACISELLATLAAEAAKADGTAQDIEAATVRRGASDDKASHLQDKGRIDRHGTTIAAKGSTAA